MAKEKIDVKDKEQRAKTCEECGVRLPYHVQSCSKVRGYICPECGARHPRHYPRCTQDIFDIGGWKMPMGMGVQRMLEEQYMVERRGAEAEGRSTRPPLLKGGWPVPRNDAVFHKDVARYLWGRVMRLKSAKDSDILQAMADPLHEDIDRLAEMRSLQGFLQEVAMET